VQHLLIILIVFLNVSNSIDKQEQLYELHKIFCIDDLAAAGLTHALSQTDGLMTFGEGTNEIDGRTVSQSDHELFKITYIVDGDTFHGISPSTGEKRKFRPIGINTPETGSRNGRPEPFHQEATAFTTVMLMNQTVKIVYDTTELDKYGRHLVYVYLHDGTFFNLEIVRAGWARTMTIPPNVKYAELFYEAQVEARTKGRGQW